MDTNLKKAGQNLLEEKLDQKTSQLVLLMTHYLAALYYNAIPAGEFFSFWCAASCGDTRGGQSHASIADRKKTAALLGINVPGGNFLQLNNTEFQSLLNAHRAQLADPQTRRALLDLLDLTAFFKMNDILTGYDLYAALCAACPGLGRISQTEWLARCKAARQFRNAFRGHSDSSTFKITPNEWLQNANALRRFIEPLQMPALATDYKRIIKIFTDVEALNSFRLCTVAELASISTLPESEVTEILLEQNYELQDSAVFCNPELVLGLLHRIVGQSARAQTAQKPRPTAASLQLLRDCTHGSLNDAQLRELCATHTLVLDETLLFSRVGRSFITGQVLPILKTLKRTAHDALLVEATMMYRLMRAATAYDDAKHALQKITGQLGSAAEMKELSDKMEELRLQRQAYLFVRELTLLPTGVPDPLSTNEEALAELLHDRSTERFCVLTCGATELTSLLPRSETPLAVVARIRSNLEGQGAVAIFPQYLPLIDAAPKPAQIGVAVDFSQLTVPAAQPGRPAPKPVSQPKPAPKLTPSAPTSAHHGSAPFEKNLPLRQMDRTLLPLTVTPAEGLCLHTEDGESVTLQGPLLEGCEEAHGGEGVLFLTDHPGTVAKLYNAEHLTAGRRDKLTEMLHHDPCVSGLCWPTHMLYTQQGDFLGYLMPQAPATAMPFSKSVLKIGSSTQRMTYMPDWTRSDLVKAARGAVRIVAGLHRNNILMGDVNAGNFMVDLKDSSRVYVVDTDSFQLGGYPCPVGFEEFTHPGTAARLGVTGGLHYDSFLRTEDDENYVLAILLFEILFIGQNPFVTMSGDDPLTSMRKHYLPYAHVNTNEDFKVPGDNWLIWCNLPRTITRVFIDTFEDWTTTPAAQWEKLLGQYLNLIQNANFSNELAPTKFHEFDPANPHYVDVTCPCCKKEFNIIKRRYEKLGGGEKPIFCNACQSIMELNRGRLVETGPCEVCGKPFAATVRDAMYMESGLKRRICPDCLMVDFTCDYCGKSARMPKTVYARIKPGHRFCQECGAQETTRCASCGEEFSTQHWRIVENRKRQRDILCPHCTEKVETTCTSCGKTFMVPRFKLDRAVRNGHGLRCPDCFNAYWR